MVISRAQCLESSALPSTYDLNALQSLLKVALLLGCWLLMLNVVFAQQAPPAPAEDQPVEISGTNDTTVFGIGHSIRITGTVTQGAMALGGDVIVEGTVEGDVATIGGSVVLAKGARIGGDVIVLGGSYKHLDPKPNRNDQSMTMMYAGYEPALRNIMRNPVDLVRPHWSPGYLGLRILAILFWFVVSIALTAAMPGTISRGMARLELTGIRVAVIGGAGAIVTAVGVPLCMLFLPGPLSTVIFLMALILILISFLFGRVIICAATGRWLQRKYLPYGKNSESVALLLGTTFWVILLSLPYVWPLVVTVLFITSLGLALTARYKVGWRNSQTV
jgi:hypothetical protein